MNYYSWKIHKNLSACFVTDFMENKMKNKYPKDMYKLEGVCKKCPSRIKCLTSDVVDSLFNCLKELTKDE